MGCLNAFIREFRQRLIDMRWQAWNDHVNTSDRFSIYRQFKTIACVEPYIMLNLNRYIRYTLTRFRFGVSDIKVHKSRFKLYNVEEDWKPIQHITIVKIGLDCMCSLCVFKISVLH